MSRHVLLAFETVRERIATLAKSDKSFRTNLRILVESLLLTIDQPTSAVEETGNEAATEGRSSTTGTELSLTEQRCRVKAEACQWAAKRIRLRQEGADFRTEIAPADREIINKANAVKCGLWMCRSSAPTPPDVSLYEVVAQCFEVLGATIGLGQIVASELSDKRPLVEEALYLVAEAQSALRAAIQRIDGPTDPDQISAYMWVRQVAMDHRIFIERFMRSDDPADPVNSADLLARVQELDVRVQESLKQRRLCRKLFGKLRHVLDQLSVDDPDMKVNYWQKPCG